MVQLSNTIIADMYNAKDKVVMVTGGAAGIGAGIVKAFLDEGAKYVAALDVDVKSGEALQTELSSKYGAKKVFFFKCDVTTTDLEVAYDSILKEHGYIDVVVNCAGIMNDHRDVYLKEIAVNFTALIKSSFRAYDLMRQDRGGKGGTIINISSIVGLFQASILPVYAATKSAVLQFSNCLGTQPHYPGSGVRVLTICFGVTDTSLISTTKMNAIDEPTNQLLISSLDTLPIQTAESAVNGLMEAYKVGASGSTWLVTSNLPAEDITGNITKAYAIMSHGVFSSGSNIV